MKKDKQITTKNEISPMIMDKEKIEKFKRLVNETMPEFVKELNNKEDLSNAMFATSQEMLVAIDDVLLRYFSFTEDEIKKFHSYLKDILQGVREFEDHGLNLTSPHSMDIVGEKIQEVGISNLLMEIAKIRLKKEKIGRAGLEYPIALQATPFIKKMRDKNK